MDSTVFCHTMLWCFLATLLCASFADVANLLSERASHWCIGLGCMTTCMFAGTAVAWTPLPLSAPQGFVSFLALLFIPFTLVIMCPAALTFVAAAAAVNAVRRYRSRCNQQVCG